MRAAPHAPSRRVLLRRLLLHLAFSCALLVASLAIGMWGYSHYEHLPWRDAFLNSAMLLGGMGPVKQDLSESGKVFAGLYALYAGVGRYRCHRPASRAGHSSLDEAGALGGSTR